LLNADAIIQTAKLFPPYQELFDLTFRPDKVTIDIRQSSILKKENFPSLLIAEAAIQHSITDLCPMCYCQTGLNNCRGRKKENLYILMKCLTRRLDYLDANKICGIRQC